MTILNNYPPCFIAIARNLAKQVQILTPIKYILFLGQFLTSSLAGNMDWLTTSLRTIWTG